MQKKYKCFQFDEYSQFYNPGQAYIDKLELDTKIDKGLNSINSESKKGKSL